VAVESVAVEGRLEVDAEPVPRPSLEGRVGFGVSSVGSDILGRSRPSFVGLKTRRAGPNGVGELFPTLELARSGCGLAAPGRELEGGRRGLEGCCGVVTLSVGLTAP
jgi:hypothetical protein